MIKQPRIKNPSLGPVNHSLQALLDIANYHQKYHQLPSAFRPPVAPSKYFKGRLNR